MTADTTTDRSSGRSNTVVLLASQGPEEVSIRSKLCELLSVVSVPAYRGDHAAAQVERDVAFVEDGMEDERSIARLNGDRAVSLSTRQQSGTNMVTVAGAVKAKLDTVRAELPDGYELLVIQDLSEFVSASVDEAQGELLRGGCLAVLVILLFLRRRPRAAHRHRSFCCRRVPWYSTPFRRAANRPAISSRNAADLPCVSSGSLGFRSHSMPK